MNLIQLFLKTSKVSLLLAVLMGLVSGASNAGVLALINAVLQGSHLPRTILLLSFLGLCLVMLISTATSQIYISRIVETIVLDLRLRLTSRILTCPLRQIEEIGIPRLLAALTQDVEVIANAAWIIALLCVFTALLLSCLIYLCWLSPLLFGITLALLLFGIYTNQALIYRGRRFLASARTEQNDLFQHFRTATEGIKELKLHQPRRRAFLTEELQTTATKSRHYRLTAAYFFAIGGSWGLVALFILIGVILFVTPLFLKIPTSVLSGYVLTLVFMFTPIRGILNSLPELFRANIALENITAMGLSLTAQGTEREQVLPITSPTQWQSLELQGVCHAYQGEREDSHFTLGSIDLSLHPGEIVFVVGGNGSGKSTLIKLLIGLYVPDIGTITFNGQPITDDNRDWYRQQFSVVFADFHLFNRLLGLESLNQDHKAQTYLQQLHLDHKVKIENGEFSTTALSQGQRKRLALLTAYLEDRAIFVFDEWASDQDPAFKQVFYTQLLLDLKQRGKAVVVVSHDDHYFHQADRILKLDYGKVEYERQLGSQPLPGLDS
jgi:putative pyoverdin transport system ATP-binding/permease protein